jgi:hypothetical protein
MEIAEEERQKLFIDTEAQCAVGHPGYDSVPEAT